MSIIIGQEPEVELDSLLRHFSPELPEVPYEMALDLIRQRYIELARKSNILNAYVELPIQKGVTNYFLTPPEGYEIYRIQGFGSPHQDRWYYPTPNAWFYPWGHRMRMYSLSQVILASPPSRDEEDRYVWVTVLPSACAASLPAPVASAWGKSIADGAVATALLMPGKPWSSPGLAQKREVDFNRGVQSAKNAMLTNNGSARAEFRPVRIL